MYFVTISIVYSVFFLRVAIHACCIPCAQTHPSLAWGAQVVAVGRVPPLVMDTKVPLVGTDGVGISSSASASTCMRVLCMSIHGST